MSALFSSDWVGCQKEETKAQVKNHELTSIESCGFFTSFDSLQSILTYCPVLFVKSIDRSVEYLLPKVCILCCHVLRN